MNNNSPPPAIALLALGAMISLSICLIAEALLGNRQFQNVLRHMETEHPEFRAEKSLRVLRDIFGLTQSALAGEVGVHASYISAAENQKYVPLYAKKRINSWLDRNSTAQEKP